MKRPINYPYPQQLPILTALLHDLQDAVRDEDVDRAGNVILEMEDNLKSLETLLVNRALDRDILEKAERTSFVEEIGRAGVQGPHYQRTDGTYELIGEADPELERLLAEEEEIQRRINEEFEN